MSFFLYSEIEGGKDFYDLLRIPGVFMMPKKHLVINSK